MNEDHFDNVRWLIGAIARGLNRTGGEAVAGVLERLAGQAIGPGDFRTPEPRGLPVLRHLPQCLGEAMLFDADIAAAIAAVEEGLQWRQSPTYTDAVLGEGFSANYGWAEIIGPNGFFQGDDFLLGLLMLGPHCHYRDHYHPAPELYWPLTGMTEWRKGICAFEIKAAGSAIWHPSLMLHATRTSDAPLLTVWCWTRDTAIRARLAQ